MAEEEELRNMYFKLKIVDMKKDNKWWSQWSLSTHTKKQKISIDVYV
jgi:hypothetical protein